MIVLSRDSTYVSSHRTIRGALKAIREDATPLALHHVGTLDGRMIFNDGKGREYVYSVDVVPCPLDVMLCIFQGTRGFKVRSLPMVASEPGRFGILDYRLDTIRD